MEYITKKIDEIKQYINNPRNNDKAITAVAESIRQCGYVSPIIVDEDMVILAGHTRHSALMRLGYTDVPVVVRKGLTENQKRKYRILDNKTGEIAVWDYTKLMQEIEGVDFNGFDFGFNKLQTKMEQDISSGYEFDMEDFNDENFKHECPECGFRFD